MNTIHIILTHTFAPQWREKNKNRMLQNFLLFSFIFIFHIKKLKIKWNATTKCALWDATTTASKIQRHTIGKKWVILKSVLHTDMLKMDKNFYRFNNFTPIILVACFSPLLLRLTRANPPLVETVTTWAKTLVTLEMNKMILECFHSPIVFCSAFLPLHYIVSLVF